MVRVAIVGSTGYTGLELCRLLLTHPEVEITHLFAHQQAGKKMGDVYPHLFELADRELEAFDVDRLPEDIDLYFLAVPHASSHEYVKKLWETGKKIIDLSSDFRFENVETFNQIYQVTHQSPDLMEHSVYGIPELNRDAIKNARLVANPGCYASSVILALHPLAKHGLISGMPIIDAKSGVTGAGRTLKVTSLYPEVNESFSAYGTGTHRHQPEIEEKIGHPVFFSPHLVPMNRGILSTCYVTPSASFSIEALKRAYQQYDTHPFMRVFHDQQLKSTAYVSGTNNCFISYHYDAKKACLVVFSMLDNLLKGASGQAVHNMNLMYGFEETLGLTLLAPYV